ncbi:chemotaxis protein CheW [Pseudoxanthomonas sp. 10H]|uniref:chemotaxis protein CheW n=1 Tax=Pseudoxanthomonas sp. 10H TaxID=3242729 RepID=UPI00355646CD
MIPAAVLDDYLDELLVPAPAVAAAPPPAAVPAPVAAASIPALPPRLVPVAAPAVPPRAVPGPVAGSVAAAADDGALPHRRAADRSSRWLRLRCAGQAYGLELLKVQEVVLPTPLLPLRGTPPAMLGVMNLRGQVVPVMDLGVHLGQAAQPGTAATRIVVLEEKGETLGLRVSAVEDVVNLTDQQVEAPDNTRAGRIHSDLFRGIARQSGDPVVLLDASRLLAPAGATA